MPDGVYENDALAWAETQAALLRRLVGSHVIKEVQDVGLSELRACRSLLRQVLVNLLKLHEWPRSHGAANWRGEVMGFLVDARDRFTASMRQRLDIQDLYAKAVMEVEAGAEHNEMPPAFAKNCALSLDDLLADRPEIGALVAKL